ncbi:LOW QUALITY PROTEIN: cyclic nucleotide-gated cation channel beta-1 [Sarcophilus harrisii]|uniref:LOW QUALITY PROTEIN: cyclic nucleotide-gated cation channel beta-1 n=1 Tax=Sarcophilus harrisii TaxID=9305 RepID=UPI000C7A2F24|nr:LOW QUALITY PROTEIN: cyclic nucleotide-gated cation channel beta-1 [Sarcophilus harrisii]
MLSWIERVLPQPPGTPQKTGAEEEAKLEPEPDLTETEVEEVQPVKEQEPEQAPREPPGCAEVPPQGKTPEVPPETVELLPASHPAQAPLVPVNSNSSGWILTLMTKGLQRVVPQPPQALIVQNLESNTNVPDKAGAQTLGNEQLNPGLAPNDNTDSQDKGAGKIMKWLVHSLEKMLHSLHPRS